MLASSSTTTGAAASGSRRSSSRTLSSVKQASILAPMRMRESKSMNEQHLRLCASSEWAKVVEEEILPWAVGARSLGNTVLEVGPGPGLVTDLLRRMTPSLTAVEIDPTLARALRARLRGTGVEVVLGDGTALPFPDGRFSAATSFTMLHHVPSPDMQDRLLAELCRVLQPGGLLVGVDSVDSSPWRKLHEGDVCVPVPPETLLDRLRAAGYADVEVEVSEHRFRFAARRPALLS
jgi:SAM-dependent methyltransferase